MALMVLDQDLEDRLIAERQASGGDRFDEVWEGIYPSSIGRLRERLLASVFTGEERPPLMPTDGPRHGRCC